MKKLYKCLLLILFLVIPSSVFAEANIIISCDSSNNIAGEVLNCSLISTVDEGVTYDRVEGTVVIPNNGTVSFSNSQVFSGSISNNKLIMNSSTSVGSNTLGTLKIKFPITTSGDSEIKLSNITFYNGDESVATVTSATSIISVASNVNTLESLTVEDCDGCTLSPTFKSDLTIYTVTTKSNKIKIDAVASDNATISSGLGEKTITQDNEKFLIRVTSEAGTEKTYQIIILKEEVKSNDNSLKSLSINLGTFDQTFSSEVTNYTANVDSDKIVISAVANHEKATIVGTGEKSLEYGKNDFPIVVTAEDGSSKSYLITINRNDDRNANAYLKELTINGKEIGFEKDIVEYDYTIGTTINSLQIVATPELESAQVVIDGNSNLKLGKNIITITVTAEDDSQKVYTIAVEKDEIIQEVIHLDDLVVDGYSLAFEQEQYDYTLTIRDEKELNIVALSDNSDYQIEIVGNSNLKDGSIIKIIVTDEEEHSAIYKIKVQTQENASTEQLGTNDINYIPIIMTSLLIILLIVDIVLFIKRLKNK